MLNNSFKALVCIISSVTHHFCLPVIDDSIKMSNWFSCHLIHVHTFICTVMAMKDWGSALDYFCGFCQPNISSLHGVETKSVSLVISWQPQSVSWSFNQICINSYTSGESAFSQHLYKQFFYVSSIHTNHGGDVHNHSLFSLSFLLFAWTVYEMNIYQHIYEAIP